MVTPTKTSIPIELMDILHSIKDDVSDVRERVIRLEAQNHSDSLKTIWLELEKERDRRMEIQIELSNVKTRLAPIIIGISLIGASIIEAIVRAIH